MFKVFSLILFLFISFNTFALNGDEQCKSWVEYTESQRKGYNSSAPPGPGWTSRHEQNGRNNRWTIWSRIRKDCISWGPSISVSFTERLGKEIGEKLEASVIKHHEIMATHLDQMEDIISTAADLQYTDFIKKLKAEMKILRDQFKQ